MIFTRYLCHPQSSTVVSMMSTPRSIGENRSYVMIMSHCFFIVNLSPFLRFNYAGQQYEGRVCFKVLIDPESYNISRKTVATEKDEMIDEEFSDGELEWSTKTDRAIYLYGLMIRVDIPHPS